MRDDLSQIVVNGIQMQIRSLVDLNAHWPEIRGRLEESIEREEIADNDLRKIVNWLVILGDKTLYRLD